MQRRKLHRLSNPDCKGQKVSHRLLWLRAWLLPKMRRNNACFCVKAVKIMTVDSKQRRQLQINDHYCTKMTVVARQQSKSRVSEVQSFFCM